MNITIDNPDRDASVPIGLGKHLHKISRFTGDKRLEVDKWMLRVNPGRIDIQDALSKFSVAKHRQDGSGQIKPRQK
jgi:hypothetical protein